MGLFLFRFEPGEGLEVVSGLCFLCRQWCLDGKSRTLVFVHGNAVLVNLPLDLRAAGRL